MKSQFAAIVAERVVKAYGDVRALDGLDLEVPEGSVFGLLGPNGAGKTTAVRILSTLLLPDAGRAVVGGHDVARDPDAVRRLIGLSGQSCAVDENLSGRQNLDMTGRLYHLGRRMAKARATDLLERFHLADAADRPARTYSGGMRRRLDLAAALVARPRILFLDEPTTGLDPRSRLTLWDVIADLAADGATVLLTTQYLEEADRLADRVAVVDAGRVIAFGAPDEFKAKVGDGRLEVVLERPDQLDLATATLRRLSGAEPLVDRDECRVSVPSLDSPTLVEVIRDLDSARVRISDIALRRPTLDDVFMALTGRLAMPDDPDHGEEPR